MKWIFIGVVVAIAIFDILLILGSAELERRQEEYEQRSNRKIDE